MVQQRYSVTLQNVNDVDNGKPTYDITGAVDITESAGIEAQTDSFNIRIHQKNMPTLDQTGLVTNENLVPRPEDRIKIYMAEGDADPKDSSDNLIIDGLIDNVTWTLSSRSKIFLIKGVNLLEAMLNAITNPVFSAKTPDFIIGNIIDQVNQLNEQKGDDFIPIGKDIASTRRDGSAFPNIDLYAQPFKPAFQMIEELSQDKYTSDGTYLFYLDGSNNFVWKARPTAIQSKVFQEGVDFRNIRAQFATFDIVNAAIIHAGDDLNGSPIFTVAYNLRSIGKIGFKWKYIAYTEAAKVIINENPGFDNDEVREASRNYAKKWATGILERLGAPRWKVRGEIQGINTYTLGNKHNILIPSLGFTVLNPLTIRITNIGHTFNRNGWVTSINFEQDELEGLLNIKPT